MRKNNEIQVELVYASTTQQYFFTLLVDKNATCQEIIEQSGILISCPEIELDKQKIGIFSKPCQLRDKVKEGDRIEIYRPLVIDPKEARRAKSRRSSSGRF